MRRYHRPTELQRYAQRRAQAFAAATADLASDLEVPFSLRPIHVAALTFWKGFWLPLQVGEETLGGWDWASLAGMYLRIPDAFHLAVWSERTLCGLAVGRPSDSHRALTVHFIEGNPQPQHPLKGKILALTLAAADAYGVVLGARTLRLKEPATGLLGLYEELGFELVRRRGRVISCERRIL